MSQRFVIRAYRPDDRPAVEEIQRVTVMRGERLPFPVEGLDDLLRLFLDWPLDEEPEWALVAANVLDDQPVGYFCGVTRLAEEERWRRDRALALAVRWAREWHRYDACTRFYYRLRLADVWASLRTPGPSLDIEVHWNELPGWRGALGSALIGGFADLALSRGRTTFSGSLNLEHGRALEGFPRVGIRLLCRRPHITLSTLLGRPIDHVTLQADAVNLRTWHRRTTRATAVDPAPDSPASA